MAGMKVVVVRTDENGNVDINDLKEKAGLHKNNLSSLMITYPSTHGVFEESIKEITSIIHQNGGRGFIDGGNLKAHGARTSPPLIGGGGFSLRLPKNFPFPPGRRARA